ncbi:zinc-binding alcohol dehydrogenase family protein [Aureimonas pseudogalii]|uniref:2-desacetyl-2-hydroxyethyl bacteriochlorophyllide A dehydrogenase n=1 Tax=Aureimonas pseudogalii TaxID=1744844 RepID=A0A7W6EB37_9HYPH|nr:zinc-binding alcohol dehydrogenase family protein [Aureimonas pseudogalii]MBB3998065.1 2-desacetyl-2-hydroxyethyl bacteriochlorophyllide A dehydrogenase [Aureimonas pseudogalii]
MRAVVCTAPGHLELTTRPDLAPPAEGWVAVDIRHVGICGTDYHIFEGKHPFLAYPRVIGHELSGVTVTAGASIAAGTPVIVNPYLACGRCAACLKGKPNCCMAIEVLGVHRDGGLCDRIHVPEGNLFPADGISLRDAAMVEFLAIGAHAVRRSGRTAGSALVVGAGPIGIGVAIFARLAGLDVTMMDTSDERLAFMADALGFPSHLKAGPERNRSVADVTAGDGFDVVFDATGNGASIQDGIVDVAHGGVYVLVSVVKDAISFADPEFHKREMQLIASRNALREDFETVVSAIRNGDVRTDRLATHSATLDEAPAGIERWAHDKAGLVKAIIDL